MIEDISSLLNRVFHEATMAHANNVLKSPKDWAMAQAIDQRLKEQSETLNRQYHEEYDARVETARQRRFDEAAQLNLDFPAPSWIRKNDAGAIMRQAHQDVRNAHQADLRRVHDEAQTELNDLKESARRRGELRGVSKDAFSHASERSESNPRIPKISQD